MERTKESLLSNFIPQLKNFIQSEMVFGKPYEIGEVTIIPVNSVKVGFGFGEGKEKNDKKGGDSGSGGGGGMMVNPIAFLIVKDGDVSMHNITSGSIENIMDKVPEFLDKLINVTSKIKDSKKKKRMIWTFTLIPVLLLFLILLSPFRLYCVYAPLEVKIAWLGVSLIYPAETKQLKLRIFFYELALAKKEKKKKDIDSKVKEKKPSAKKAKKKSKNIFEKILRLLSEPVFSKIVTEVYRLLERIVSAFKIAFLNVQFCLDDFYWQGILSGFAINLPASRRFQVESNFMGYNHVDLRINASIGKILLALLIFLIRFPYWQSFKAYRSFKK